MIDEILNTPSNALAPLWYNKSTAEALDDIRRGYYRRRDISTVLITNDEQDYLIIISSGLHTDNISDITFRYINTEFNLDFVDILLEDNDFSLTSYMI